MLSQVPLRRYPAVCGWPAVIHRPKSAIQKRVRSKIRRRAVAVEQHPGGLIGALLDAPSAVEDRPADGVPQALIVKHERANRIGQLRALPQALEPGGAGL